MQLLSPYCDAGDSMAQDSCGVPQMPSLAIDKEHAEVMDKHKIDVPMGKTITIINHNELMSK